LAARIGRLGADLVAERGELLLNLGERPQDAIDWRCAALAADETVNVGEVRGDL
jgi:hypothetical protein